MTLEQLRIFLAVAEHLHFTRAAEELYITQPAVSAAVQSLEAYFGVKLFHRIGRHIEITDAGILGHVTKLLNRLNQRRIGNSYRLINRPITISCIRMDLEKQIVFLAKRLIRVLKVKCLRSIF